MEICISSILQLFYLNTDYYWEQLLPEWLRLKFNELYRIIANGNWVATISTFFLSFFLSLLFSFFPSLFDDYSSPLSLEICCQVCTRYSPSKLVNSTIAYLRFIKSLNISWYYNWFVFHFDFHEMIEQFNENVRYENQSAPLIVAEAAAKQRRLWRPLRQESGVSCQPFCTQYTLEWEGFTKVMIWSRWD